MSQVLVVEDYEDARVMVEMILEDAGYRVLVAADGVEGVSMARRHRPDAIWPCAASRARPTNC